MASNDANRFPFTSAQPEGETICPARHQVGHGCQKLPATVDALLRDLLDDKPSPAIDIESAIPYDHPCAHIPFLGRGYFSLLVDPDSCSPAPFHLILRDNSATEFVNQVGMILCWDF